MPSQAAPGQSPGGYFPALDGIRALAILLVIPHNVNVLVAPASSVLFPAVAVAHAGWVGVQLFFVLSGFLITGALLDSQRAENYYSSFFWRRALRILPLYYAVLLLAFVVAPLLISLPAQFEATRHNGVWLWTFLSNWTQPYGKDVFGFAHFWSLAVEEQFYLLWPFIVRHRTPRSMLWLCLSIATAALVARAAMELLHFPHEALYMFTISRMDALALGAAAAAALRVPQIRQLLERNLLRVTVLALILLGLNALTTRAFSAFDNVEQTIGYLLLAVSYALLMFPAVLPATGLLQRAYGVLGWLPLRLVGRYSYAMYVIHFPLHIFIGQPLLASFGHPPPMWVAFCYAAAMVLASFALGALSYHGFERHFLRLKHRFFGAPVTTPSAQAS